MSFLPLLSFPPVLAELKQVGLITSKECRRVYVPRDVVRAQSGKLPEVQTKTAVLLRGHGFEKESNLLAGKQAQTCINVSVVCCTVDSSHKDNLKASIIIVSFKHIMLGHSK